MSLKVSNIIPRIVVSTAQRYKFSEKYLHCVSVMPIITWEELRRLAGSLFNRKRERWQTFEARYISVRLSYVVCYCIMRESWNFWEELMFFNRFYSLGERSDNTDRRCLRIHAFLRTSWMFGIPLRASTSISKRDFVKFKKAKCTHSCFPEQEQTLLRDERYGGNIKRWEHCV